MSKKAKKIPIVTYVCYLLVVASLVTGVTLSRYVSGASSAGSITVSPFACNYVVTDLSASTFNNLDYWYSASSSSGSSSETTATNTPRSLAFSVYNYVGNTVTEVDVAVALRMSMPAEFFDNAAFQVLDITGNVVYPQYAFGDLVAALQTSQTSPTSAYTNTSSFTDYGEITGATNEDFTVTYSENFFTSTGTLTISSDSMDVKITCTMQAVSYSLNYERGVEKEADGKYYVSISDSSSGSVSSLYLDCTRTERYYTVDITLKDGSGSPKTLTGSQKTQNDYQIYLTTIDQFTGGDYNSWISTLQGSTPNSAIYSLSTNKTATDGEAGFLLYTSDTANGPTVTGYHFDVDVNEDSATATYTVYAEYGAQAISFYYYSSGGAKVTVSEDDTTALNQALYAAITAPLGAETSSDDGTTVYQYAIGDMCGKEYPFELTVLFWQASEISGST